MNALDCNLNLLVTFATLAETKSFVATARKLQRSQPTVSRQISELEKQLHVKLFLRDRYRVELTEEGRRLRAQTVPHLNEVLRGLSREQETHAGHEGTVRFASLSEVGQSTFMAILLGFQRKHPRVALEVSYIEEPEIWEGLRAGTVDFGIVSSAGHLENIRAYKVLEERIVLVTRASNTATLQGFPAESIPFVKYRVEDPLYDAFVRAQRKALRARLEPHVSVNAHRSMIDALLSSDCYAVLPLLSVRSAVEEERLRIVSGYEVTQQLYLAHPVNPYEDKWHRDFQKMVIEACHKIG